ncbi:MAG: precorrin-2/cobalt-factor-2 C20-methyltransferase [Paracoccaceae bacterium]
MNGTLYGIGLGPGDPELMTLKAHRLISGADVVAYPALVGGRSFARSIAAEFLKAGVREIVIEVPMQVDRGPAQAAYDLGAAEIAKVLEAGQDVVVLCEGDPLFYGSFMYVQARLSDRFDVVVVPGVNSVNASAAASGLPLVARNEVLSVLPGPMAASEMATRIEAADAVAIMKVGRHLAKIRSVLDELGLAARAVYIERASTPEQKVMPLVDAPDAAPYFSMILVTKGADPWL